MVKFKKIAILVLSFSSVFAANEVNDVTTGIARITKIMSNDETGIGAYNKKNIRHAETQNIVKDLNIDQIAEFFNCKTIIGKTFLTETLSCPVSPQDKNSVLKKRQDAIKILVENPDLKEEVEELLEVLKPMNKRSLRLCQIFLSVKPVRS